MNVLVADFQLATQKKKERKKKRKKTQKVLYCLKEILKKILRYITISEDTHCVHIVDKETDSAALLLLVFPVEGDFLQGAR